MKWDMEERIEDSMTAYLRTLIPATVKVHSAWDLMTPQFPCVITHCGETGPVSEGAAWHNPRAATIQVAIMTEAAPELGDGGIVVATARERNAAVRAMVIEQLAISDLAERLTLAGVHGIGFSMAQMTTTTRNVEDRVLVTTVTIEAIAEPIEE